MLHFPTMLGAKAKADADIDEMRTIDVKSFFMIPSSCKFLKIQ